ncbi:MULTISPECIES: hypothetical protein [unclassified Streptomyces]|uniref:hypothetical protein n=1 Tax=unclassified Streptomyces TaxID=2593676 RepID=UPI00278C7299|nr:MULTISPECIES: hypothetical protein [unclassified Streptomyces]
MPDLHLKTLKCVTQEDLTFDDDVILKVNGDNVLFTSMDDGESYKVDQYISFTSKAVVKLYEADYNPGDDDDFLGAHTVRSGSGTLHFTRDGANYQLSYAVS